MRSFSRTVSVRVLLSVLVAAPALALAVSPALAAETKAPWWSVGSEARPSILAPGGTGELIVTVSNLGDMSVRAASSAVAVTDTLPAGIQVTGVIGSAAGTAGILGKLECATALPARTIGCKWAGGGPLQPYERLEVRLAVEATGAVAAGARNEVSVAGGEGYACRSVGAGAGKFTGPLCNFIDTGEGGGYEGEPTGVPVRPAGARLPVRVEGGPVPFGVEQYDLNPEDADGMPNTQAGSHPFQLTTTTVLNTNGDPETPPQLVKDLRFKWPPGLVGDPSATPQCTEVEFNAILPGDVNRCPADTAVGVASLTFVLKASPTSPPVKSSPVTFQSPVFNLVPAAGEPARVGFLAFGGVVVTIDTAVRSGGDYGVTVKVDNITQLAALLSSKVSIWGDPASPVHDQSRGWSCVAGGLYNILTGGIVPPCASTPSGGQASRPFLIMPTTCDGPLSTVVEADSWAEPAHALTYAPTQPMPALSGCNALPFGASIEATPDVHSASTPSGLHVHVHVPQEASLNPEGIAGADVRDTTVTLPAGVAINPSDGDGLAACTGTPSMLAAGALGSPGDQIGYTGEQRFYPGQSTGQSATVFTGAMPEPLLQGENFCSNASKLGEVTIETPLLPNPLKGFVYLASQDENPFGSLMAMYLVAEDPVSGVLLKLPGEVSLSSTGQITTTFKNTPQQPFENLDLHFFGGERAPLTTPARCGSYTTEALFTPWSGNAPVSASSTFQITSGPDGQPCPGSSLPFSPSLTGGATNGNGGAYSPLTTTIGRQDGEQNMQSVTLHMPPGLSGILTGVPLCPEAQANAGSCGPASLIGETTVSAGVGSDPVSVKGGKVYLTEKYAGAPFGLSIVNPVKAGPFDLEHDTSKPATNMPPCDCVVVRAKIEVNPLTAALTVTTDPSGEHAIPHLIDGVPVQIKKVNVLIDRPGFTFNPTDCKQMQITGSISSDEGASSPVSVPFDAANCATLAFEPSFKVSTSGKTSRADGASLHVRLAYPNAPFGTQANLRSVKVDLPRQLPSQLKTLQQACTAAQFAANPAGCPVHSIVGHAVVHTQLLPVPLEGPAYFVSHGGEEFPNLIMVLQGDGVTIRLVGDTFIKNGVTSSTFSSTPDVPFETFELTLPQGRYSALAANGNLCKLTRTTTVKKKVRVKAGGRTRTVTREVRETVAGKLAMPTAFVGQNGATIHQSTPIAVTGCPGAKASAKARRAGTAAGG